MICDYIAYVWKEGSLQKISTQGFIYQLRYKTLMVVSLAFLNSDGYTTR